MRTRIWLCIGVIVATGLRSACGLEIAGQVVDSKARPVEGAEVAVYERDEIPGYDYDANLIAPIVNTDSQGAFQLQANVSASSAAQRPQRETFIVARKRGLALAWDGLNYSDNTLGKGHFSLVLEPPCVLTGQLVDPNGKPVAQAQVQALPVTGYLERLRQRPILMPKEWFTTTTDSQGRFRFEQFAADVSVTFRVNVPGSTGTNVLRTQRQEAFGFEVWRSDIRLVLPREGIVRGRVVNSQGKPVAGVDLLIGPDRQSREFMGLYLARKTKSQPDGTFAFDGIPEGPHQIDVPAPEQGPDQWVGKSVNVSLKPGQKTAEATVQVTQGSMVEVTVLNMQTKRPLAGMKVGAYAPGWRRSEKAIADAKGVARFRAPAGTCMIETWSDEFLPGQDTEQVTDGQPLRCQILPSPRSRLTGRVFGSAGQPVADVAITIQPFGDHVYTDAEGRFSGHWNEQYAPRSGIVVARDTRNGLAAVKPVPDWFKPADLHLTPAWTLTGKIVDSNGVGLPAARVTLLLYSSNSMGDLGVEILTDSQGRFEMKAIPPVQSGFEYRLSANAAGYGPKQGLRISVSGSPGTMIDMDEVSLLPANVTVSGVVVDAGGTPAAQVPVTFNGLPGKCTTTNAKGEFTLTRVCQGMVSFQASLPTGENGSFQTELPIPYVKIVIGQNIKSTGETPIAGKPLPSLADLSDTLSNAQLNGKAILICFMDIEQRPSRQCLLELAKKASALAAQDVSLLVVQTAKVDMKQQEAWLKENRVTIPIHIASADFEMKRRAWGVKSLPWLILADKGHVVHVEGFAISDLDKVLQEVK